jgi:5-methylcytosine-specific restriction endonuclease McrA
MTPYADKEAQRTFQREWMRSRRSKWVADNGPCRVCGSSDNLEVDHIDPSLKTMSPRSIWSLSDKNKRKTAELDNCQVLCKVCHLKKTLEERAAKRRNHDLHGNTTSLPA